MLSIVMRTAKGKERGQEKNQWQPSPAIYEKWRIVRDTLISTQDNVWPKVSPYESSRTGVDFRNWCWDPVSFKKWVIEDCTKFLSTEFHFIYLLSVYIINFWYRVKIAQLVPPTKGNKCSFTPPIDNKNFD